MNSDWEIIEKVLAGDVNAFEGLVHAHKAHIFKIVWKMVGPAEAEEVAQQVFVKAFTDLAGYRRKAPLEHWLARIAVRTSTDFWRKKRRDRLMSFSGEELQFLEERGSREDSLEGQAVERARDLMDRVLEHLAPEDRLVFTLLYLEELPMKEAALALNWSVARVKIRSFRARRALRKVLSDELRG